MAGLPFPPQAVLDSLRRGLVIPAHPLALRSDRSLDERRQRALTRYYHAAGAGGIAVGVHTTQFEIRDPRHGLLEPVLELAADTVEACDRAAGRRTVRIAGICGPTQQAVAEARAARDVGYHIGLLSLAVLREATDDELVAHCHEVARVIPLMGFYLQPAVGGRLLPYSFWRRFVEVPNVVAIKIAPFNRYHTLDMVRAVADSGRAGQIALYTGNDDNIVADLVTPFVAASGKGPVHVHIVGGLLGHWACWTLRAVETLAKCRAAREAGVLPAEILTLAAQVTDCNAAFFDAAHGYAGALPGISEVLRRQGLLDNALCLDPEAMLSPGQADEIDRVYAAYPNLNDDAFVTKNLHTWLS